MTKALKKAFEAASRLPDWEQDELATAIVRTWGRLHREELERDWELARANRPLRRIAPLE